MSQFKRLAMGFLGSVAVAFVLAGCAQQPGREVAFQGGRQRICAHPSMTGAAYREAYACHEAARIATRERAAQAARRAVEAAPRARIAGR